MAFSRPLGVVPVNLHHVLVPPGGVTESFVAVDISAAMRFIASTIIRMKSECLHGGQLRGQYSLSVYVNLERHPLWECLATVLADVVPVNRASRH